MYEVVLPDGTTAECATLAAALVAVETLIDDVRRYMRENVVVKKDGEFDAAATDMAQHEGMYA